MSQTNNIQQLFQSVFSTIDEDLQEFLPLKRATQNIAVRPGHIFLGVVLLLLIVSALTSSLAHILITLFAMIYPSYMSFRAINLDLDQMRKKWLTYWVVFAFATVFDTMLSVILFFLPAYYAFKVLFFIWLFYPRTDGAAIIYQKIVKPNLKRITQSMKKIHES